MKKELKVEHILDGDNRRRVVFKGITLGWITKWYQRDALNETGIKRFLANPIGSGQRLDCETYQSAVAFILGYHEDFISRG